MINLDNLEFDVAILGDPAPQDIGHLSAALSSTGADVTSSDVPVGRGDGNTLIVLAELILAHRLAEHIVNFVSSYDLDVSVSRHGVRFTALHDRDPDSVEKDLRDFLEQSEDSEKGAGEQTTTDGEAEETE